jgi:Fe-S-cluster containining protein
MILCSSCHGGCCRRYPVDLTGFDIINIVRNMMLNVSVFLEVVPVKIEKPEDVEEKMKSYAVFKFKDSDNYFRLCLKRHKSTLMPETFKCVFLQEWPSENSTNNIAGRCGIYKFRPYICQTFPMMLDKKGLFAYIYDPATKDKNFPSDNPAYQICPEALTMENFGKYMTDYKRNQTLAIFKFEKDFFAEVARQWNSQVQGTFDEFLLSLQKIYDNRIQGPINQNNINIPTPPEMGSVNLPKPDIKK